MYTHTSLACKHIKANRILVLERSLKVTEEMLLPYFTEETAAWSEGTSLRSHSLFLWFLFFYVLNSDLCPWTQQDCCALPGSSSLNYSQGIICTRARSGGERGSHFVWFPSVDGCISLNDHTSIPRFFLLCDFNIPPAINLTVSQNCRLLPLFLLQTFPPRLMWRIYMCGERGMVKRRGYWQVPSSYWGKEAAYKSPYVILMTAWFKLLMLIFKIRKLTETC